MVVLDFKVNLAVEDVLRLAATFGNQLAEQVHRATNGNNGNTADNLTAFLDAVQAVEIIGNFFSCVLARGG